MAKKGSKKNVEDAAIIHDLETQLEATVKARDEKLEGSKTHLKAQLEMAKQKYLTVNGFMQARSTYDQVLFGMDAPEKVDEIARGIATTMSYIAGSLAEKLDKVDIMDLDESFLDGLLVPDFVGAPRSDTDTVEQLLTVNLLQNVGPAIDDIVQFRAGAADAIEKIQAELDKYAKPKLEVVN